MRSQDKYFIPEAIRRNNSAENCKPVENDYEEENSPHNHHNHMSIRASSSVISTVFTDDKRKIYSK